MLYVQIIGRALRTSPGKDHALILDHTDTTTTLGFVTDIHHDALDCRSDNEKDAKEERKPDVAKPCPSCAALSMRIARVCQNCGHEFPLHTMVDTEDGELTELVKGARHKSAGKRKYTMDEKREWYGMLLCHARRHDYKDGWAANQHRDKFGEWPAKKRGIPLIEPSYEVASWIKSRQIAYAKSKGRTPDPAPKPKKSWDDMRDDIAKMYETETPWEGVDDFR